MLCPSIIGSIRFMFLFAGGVMRPTHSQARPQHRASAALRPQADPPLVCSNPKQREYLARLSLAAKEIMTRRWTKGLGSGAAQGSGPRGPGTNLPDEGIAGHTREIPPHGAGSLGLRPQGSGLSPRGSPPHQVRPVVVLPRGMGALNPAGSLPGTPGGGTPPSRSSAAGALSSPQGLGLAGADESSQATTSAARAAAEEVPVPVQGPGQGVGQGAVLTQAQLVRRMALRRVALRAARIHQLQQQRRQLAAAGVPPRPKTDKEMVYTHRLAYHTIRGSSVLILRMKTKLNILGLIKE